MNTPIRAYGGVHTDFQSLKTGKTLGFKQSLILLLLLTFFGNTWGQTSSTLQLSPTYMFATTSGSTKASTSGTSVIWTTTSTSGNIQNSWNGANYLGQQFGTATTAWTGRFSASLGSGATISKIEIRANTGNLATLAVSVGGTPFSPASLNVVKNSSATDANLSTYTFTGSSTGSIVITVSGTAAAFYLNRIIITYNTAAIPTVITTDASTISANSADSGGNITSDGGATLDARGVSYGIVPNPTVAGTKTSDGTGTGVFTSSLTSLSINTQYFYRAYATNSVGTAYGAESSFYTLANVPNAPTVATPGTTTLNVSIPSDDGNPGNTVYAIHETTTNKFVQTDGSLGTTEVWQTATLWGTKTVTGLTPSTTYTFETKARNGAAIETAYGATASGTTNANQSLDYWNLQYPENQIITEGSTFDVYAQAYKGGLTEGAGQAAGLNAWIGYSSSNTSPNGSGWTWIPSDFNVQVGNNDEFKATLGTGLTPGTYYYASRFQLDGGTYQYGGYGGNWSSNSGVLTVNSNTVGYANIQYPFSGMIVQGGNFDVYAQVYKEGITDTGSVDSSKITSWIGISTTNATTESDFASWTWIPASYNTKAGNNFEYVANIAGAARPAGTYYYVSRFQVAGSTEYKYGGTNNNFWTGSENSGILNVQTPQEINIKQGVTNIPTTGTYAFGTQLSGTSSSVITFRIENSGQENLSVGALGIDGTSASEFTITQPVSSTVNGGSSTTFTVTFSPTSVGVKAAQLSLVNDDADENPYIINLTGSGIGANDNCSGAIGLIINSAATAGTFVGSTPQSGFTQNDMWYSFTPTCTGEHTISVGGFAGADIDFAVYANSCPASSSTTVFRASGTSNNPETNTYTYVEGTTYYIRVYKYSGTDGPFDIRITTPALGTPTNITASSTALCAGATVTFTANAVTNATSYVWEVPTDWTITGQPSINTMTATVGFTAGLVKAKAINCYGEGVQRSVNFTPGTIPATPGSITGNTTVCQSSSNTYTVAPVSGATSYTWTLPSGWTGTSTTTSITTTAGENGGAIFVTANNTCGSSALQTLTVAVSAPPATPAVPSSDNASCGNITLTRGTPPTGEIWYWQGTNANGTLETDSNSIYTVTASGTYYLRSKNSATGCWSATSSSVLVNVNPVTAITAQPTNQSATTGSTGTFTVVAAGNGLIYQWQESTDGGLNWNNVTGGTGANTASYTTAITTLEMNSYKYRVAVSGSCGNVTSDGNATLSVADIIYVNGDFRSVSNGTWTNNATPGTARWEKYSMSTDTWILQPVGTEPSGTAGAFTVYIQHDIEIPAAGTSAYGNAKIYVNDGGYFKVSVSGVTWTFRNLIIDNGGKMELKGRFTVLSSGDFEIKNGGDFIFNNSSPTFTSLYNSVFAGKEKFAPNSNFIIKDLNGGNFLDSQVMTAILPNSLNSYFGNIVIDYLNGANNFTMFTTGTQTTAAFTKTICNDLIFRSVNNNNARIYQNTTNYIQQANPITIGRDFIIEPGFNQNINFTSASHGSASFYLKINRDFIHTGPNPFVVLNATNNSTLYYLIVGRDVNIADGSKFYFRPTSNVSTASIYLQIGQHLKVMTTGEVADLGSNVGGGGIIWFNGTGIQNLDFKNAASNIKVSYSVRSGSSVQLVNQSLSLGNTSSFSIASGGTFNFNFNGNNILNVLNAAGSTGTSFTQQANSTLYITSTAGIQSVGATGNVQTDTRTFATATPYADFHFIGNAPQVTGTGLPENVRDITIQNTAAANEVTLTNTAASFIVNRSLDVQSGIFNLNDKNVSGVSAATLNIEGLSTLKISGDKTFPLGFSSIVFKPTSIVEYGGTTQTVANSTISGYLNLPAYQTLKVSGSGVKTATGTTTVNEMTMLTAPASKLLVPAYDALATPPVHSVLNANGGIHNTNGNTGDFIIENDAMLMQNPAADNSQALIKARRTHEYKADNSRKEYNFLSSPVAHQNMKAIYGNNPANVPFVTRLNEPTNLFVNAGAAEWDGPEDRGKGFAVREPKFTGYAEINGDGLPQTIAQYKGQPNNGALELPLSYTPGRGYNLAGNPYPSNIDLIELYANSVDINSATPEIDPSFRFWDNKVNDIYSQMGGAYTGDSYAVFNAKTDTDGFGVVAPGNRNGGPAGEKTPDRYIKVSQAFMVRARTATAKLKFDNTIRKTNPGTVFFGKSSSKNRYHLELVKWDGLTFQNGIAYFDVGKKDFGLEDTRILNTAVSDALFTYAGDAKVIINGRSAFTDSDVVNLGLRHFAAGTYKIQVVNREGVFANGQSIYLKDKQLGILADLTAGNYTFTSQAGEFTNRFEIVYRTETTLGTGNDRKSGIEVYREGSSFVIRSSGEKIISTEVYDAAGRLLLSLEGNTRELRFEADRLAEGMYVLKTILSNGEHLSKKIRK